MIIKSFETNKINPKFNSLILLYGKNEGLKNQVIADLLKNKTNKESYEEKDILNSANDFIEGLLTNSLFENEKIIIIKRVTDKILKIIEEIKKKNLDNLIIILNADLLDKKSKLRILFEKDKEDICIPIYPDNNQTLTKIILSFFKEKNIHISQTNINLILSKSNGDRENLQNELKKIESLCLTRKVITAEDISKITNLIENHSISELADNCLAKNKKKIIKIFNENNFNNEDYILIVRTLLNKSKKILKLSYEFQKNKNLDLTITSSKPPIFWKEKEITKQQLLQWKPDDIRRFIYEINDLELHIKKNISNSINILSNFILEKSNSQVNS